MDFKAWTSCGAALALAALTAPCAASPAETLALSCSGENYGHGNPFSTPETASLSISGPRSVAIAIGSTEAGKPSSARVISNNAIQLKFAAGPFTAEYFHYTGDLFLIHKNGSLIRLVCKPN